MVEEHPLSRDREMMLLAMGEAGKAAAAGDIPCGAVVTGPDGDVLAVGHNRREADGDPTAHAEVLALRAAAAVLGAWRLDGCTVYVTKEPCPMCAGAIFQARVSRLVYGVPDAKAGAAGTLFNLVDDPRLNHRMKVVAGLLEEETAGQLKRFFEEKR